MAIAIFLVFVSVLLGLSFYLGSKAKSASGYFVAGGNVHWFINGIALTGGYLSAASFLGICGMIAFTGFDGYLYSIGFLAGWVVALFVVAEPLRRLGKYTLADALAAKFDNRGIHLAAGLSTLMISLCYLIPQMVGAGVLMEPLTGIPYHWGVVMVGGIVIAIVATAGMTSTTYVQFLKAGLLIMFCFILVVAMCWRGLDTEPPVRNTRGAAVAAHPLAVLQIPDGDLARAAETAGYHYERTVRPDSGGREWILLTRLERLEPVAEGVYSFPLRGATQRIEDKKGRIAQLLAEGGTAGRNIGGVECLVRDGAPFVRLESWWYEAVGGDGAPVLREAQHLGSSGDELLAMGRVAELPEGTPVKQAIGPLRLASVFADPATRVELPRATVIQDGDRTVRLYHQTTVAGNELMRPGGHFKLRAASPWPRLDFISLMLALFFGTSALPHVLIRYYTVPSSTAARRSTVVAIGAIGTFYILTLYLGLGAIVNGVLNPGNSNMAAPLLARSFGEIIFAAVSSVAFATVLGTVAGLIVAAAGAVANDLVERGFGLSHSGAAKVLVAKAAAVTVGLVAIVLGILLKGMNVGFLVGWAFAVAASANFPSIIMVLFWKGTTSQGVVASILTGIVGSLGIILLGPDMFEVYGLGREAALIPLGQPGLISMPLSFLVLIVVSLMTNGRHCPRDKAV